MPNSQEVALIRAFVRLERQEQWRVRLANPKTREKMLGKLYHFHEFDGRFAHRLPVSEQFAAAIYQLLRAKGAPTTCYVISTDNELDGRHVDLREVLERTVGSGHAMFLSCIPGKLGYFEGEERNERYILEREDRL